MPRHERGDERADLCKIKITFRGERLQCQRGIERIAGIVGKSAEIAAADGPLSDEQRKRGAVIDSSERERKGLLGDELIGAERALCGEPRISGRRRAEGLIEESLGDEHAGRVARGKLVRAPCAVRILVRDEPIESIVDHDLCTGRSRCQSRNECEQTNS